MDDPTEICRRMLNTNNMQKMHGTTTRKHCNDEFFVKMAKTLEEIKAPLEVSFERLCTIGGIHLYRKWK